MDRARVRFDHLHPASQPAQFLSSALSIVSSVVVAYLLLLYLYPHLPTPQQLLWDAVVRITPQRLLLHRAQLQELRVNGLLAHTHEAKKEALKEMLGLGSATLLNKLPASAGQGIGAVRRASTTMFARPRSPSDLPPGLGNWDNSCYQNAVLQGLASLASIKEYLDKLRTEDTSTSGTLRQTVTQLTDTANNGQELWTPAKLKSMSSWQQQDAQEYYSKILDEIDKETVEARKRANTTSRPGLEALTQETAQLFDVGPNENTTEIEKSPLDGLLAQKVACTRCGFSEGLSMIPFNCLTLPLPLGQTVLDVKDCLDEYTKREEITDVECAKCTLIRAEQQLVKMLPANPGAEVSASPDVDTKVLQLPPELRAQAFKRLAAVQRALATDQFSDKTLEESCRISKKARVSSTKTKKAIVARPPQCLVMHLNRSVFDEQTGVQRKNYARVLYPLILDVAPWMVDEDDSGESLLEESVVYRLKAVVTHYGRHENGHYICFRQHPSESKPTTGAGLEESMDGDDEDTWPGSKEPWYRLSDEDVSVVSKDDVLGQGGAFMLFYERVGLPELPVREDIQSTIPVDRASRVPSETVDQIVLESPSGPPVDDGEVAVGESVASSVTEPEPEIAIGHPALETPTSSKGASEDEQLPADETPLDAANSPKTSSPSPLRMRTARVPVLENEFAGGTFRAMAAT